MLPIGSPALSSDGIKKSCPESSPAVTNEWRRRQKSLRENEEHIAFPVDNVQARHHYRTESQPRTDDTNPRRHTKPEEEEQQQYEPYNSNNRSNRRTKKKTNAQG
ncbi:hypothetical protein M513_09250, partial [Trichuris suis]